MTTRPHPDPVYPNAPVALVAVEITFPGEIGGQLAPALQRAMAEVLGDNWITDPVQGQSRFTVNLLGPGAPAPVVEQFPLDSMLLRFSDRERGSAIALTSGSVSVQTTCYKSWPIFREVVGTAVALAGRLLRPNGVTRLGVRYIDEIRVPAEDPHWEDWLNVSILPPAFQMMSERGWRGLVWNGVAQYRIGDDDQNLLLRYGPQDGFAVNPDGPLRRPGTRPDGPFFMLDFDASWQPGTIPRWDTEELVSRCDDLRDPIKVLFNDVVTPRLVSEVFEQGGVRR